jgi:hypothetical protein
MTKVDSTINWLPSSRRCGRCAAWVWSMRRSLIAELSDL